VILPFYVVEVDPFRLLLVEYRRIEDHLLIHQLGSDCLLSIVDVHRFVRMILVVVVELNDDLPDHLIIPVLFVIVVDVVDDVDHLVPMLLTGLI
jgi:hypothetical protein